MVLCHALLAATEKGIESNHTWSHVLSSDHGQQGDTCYSTCGGQHILEDYLHFAMGGVSSPEDVTICNSNTPAMNKIYNLIKRAGEPIPKSMNELDDEKIFEPSGSVAISGCDDELDEIFGANSESTDESRYVCCVFFNCVLFFYLVYQMKKAILRKIL